MAVNSFNAQNPPVTTKGDLFTFSTIPTRLGVGANNTVLTADSTTATGLKWATVAAGGMTQLASGSFSSNILNLTSISANYRHLQLFIRDLRPGNDNRNLQMRFNNDSNSRYAATTSNSASNIAFNQTQMNFDGQMDSIATDSMILIEVFDYANTATWKFCRAQIFVPNPTTSTNLNFGFSTAFYNQTSAISELNLFTNDNADFAAGTYILYGVS